MLIDPAHRFASWFLVVSASLFLVGYALPLAFAPLAWARRLKWPVPAQDTRLTVYFGRCLGVLAIAVIVFVFRAAPMPAMHREIFELVATIGALMVGVHAWGALRRVQPWTEDAEIPLYALLAGLALYARLTLA